MVLKRFKRLLGGAAVAANIASPTFAQDLPDVNSIVHSFSQVSSQQVAYQPTQGDFISASELSGNQILDISQWNSKWDGKYTFFATNNKEAAMQALNSSENLDSYVSSFNNDKTIPSSNRFSYSNGEWIVDNSGMAGSYVVRFKLNSGNKFVAESLWLVLEQQVELPKGVGGHVSNNTTWMFIGGDSKIKNQIQDLSSQIDTLNSAYEQSYQKALESLDPNKPESLREFLLYIHQLNSDYLEKKHEILLSIYQMPTPDSYLVSKLNGNDSISNFIDSNQLKNTLEQFFAQLSQSKVTNLRTIFEEAKDIIARRDPYSENSTNNRAQIYSELREKFVEASTELNTTQANVQGILDNSQLHLSINSSGQISLKEFVESLFSKYSTQIEKETVIIRQDFEGVVGPIYQQILLTCENSLQSLLEQASFSTKENMSHFKQLISNKIDECDEEANKLARESGNPKLAEDIREAFTDSLQEVEDELNKKIKAVRVTNEGRQDSDMLGILQRRIQNVYDNIRKNSENLENFNINWYEPTIEDVNNLYRELCTRKSRGEENVSPLIQEIEQLQMSHSQCVATMKLRTTDLYSQDLNNLRDYLVDIAIYIQLHSNYSKDKEVREIVSIVERLNSRYSSSHFLKSTQIDELILEKEFMNKISKILEELNKRENLSSSDFNPLLKLSQQHIERISKFEVSSKEWLIGGGIVSLFLILILIGAIRRIKKNNASNSNP